MATGKFGAPAALQSEKMRQSAHLARDNVCVVCGDKAQARNFGALSCDTCKAFFRRNACKRLDLKPCTSDNNCHIDIYTRKNCPACRLTKCFSAGMKSELILNEDQRREINEKIQKNRLKKKDEKERGRVGEKVQVPHLESAMYRSMFQTLVDGNEVSINPAPVYRHVQSPSSTGSDAVSSVSGNGHTHHLHNAELVLHNQTVADQVTATTQICHNGQFHTAVDTDYFLPVGEITLQVPASTTLDKTASQLVAQKRAPKLDLNLLSRDQLPSDPQMYQRLTAEERTTLMMLSSAYDSIMLTGINDCQNRSRIDMSQYGMKDIFEDYEAQCLMGIKYVKQLEDFRKLKQDEQIACFKGTTMTTLAVRTAYKFIVERRSWIMLKGEMTEDQLKQLLPFYPYHDFTTEIMMSLKSVAKNDITLYALLHCILLFDPSNSKLTDRQTIGSIRDKYILLLRHYLESTYSYAYADHYMRFFQDKLIEIQVLGQLETEQCQSEIKNQAEHCDIDYLLKRELLVEIHCHA